MREKTFYREWDEAVSRLRIPETDIRERVWKRIAADCPGAAPIPEPGAAVLWKLDIAAAAVITVGAGVMYFVLSEFSSEIFWNTPFHSLVNSYF